MTYSLTKAALILALAGTLGACTDAGRFGKKGRDDAAAGGGDVSTAAIDPALNPTSPAYFSQTIGDRVLFPVDQSSLSSEGRAVLDGQASWLASNTAYAAIIEGHADEQGTREYNLALGARRANAVQEYLISKGVAGNRLRTVSYGKERPIEVCSDELCYAKNRRAVTVLSAGAGS